MEQGMMRYDLFYLYPLLMSVIPFAIKHDLRSLSPNVNPHKLIQNTLDVEKGAMEVQCRRGGGAV